jgi:diacylglycerol kinase (ATP)
MKNELPSTSSNTPPHKPEKNQNPKNFLKKRIAGFGFAFKGVSTLFRMEVHARIHLLAVFAVAFAGFIFKISRSEWCIIALTCTIVLSAEAFNTAIETVINLVSPGHNELAGRAKDVAAGGVLITAIGAVVVGIIIFLPYLRVYFLKF